MCWVPCEVGVLQITHALVIEHQLQGEDRSSPSGGCYEDDLSVLGSEILINESLDSVFSFQNGSSGETPSVPGSCFPSL